jgi:hypothetical protein
MVSRYGAADKGGMIVHSTLPENFPSRLEATIHSIESLADDPKMKAIITLQAVPGTAQAFRNIRAKRPDIILIATQSHEDMATLAPVSDVVVTMDFISRGYLIPRTAKELGASTLLHLSFPRHMINEPFSRQRQIMRVACEDLGINFVSETAPDPTGPAGIVGSQAFIRQEFPSWLSQYGPDTAFFSTNNGLTGPLISSIIEHGGYFVEGNEASPLLGYTQALGLDVSNLLDNFPELLSHIEKAVVARGAGGRLGTWPNSLLVSHTEAMMSLAISAIKGEIPINNLDLDTILQFYNAATPGNKWNGLVYVDVMQRPFPNAFLVHQDTYIFGRGFMGNTDLTIPNKYITVTESDKGAQVNFHIAVVTSDGAQGADDYLGALAALEKYGSVEDGGIINHVTYPLSHMNDPDAFVQLLLETLEDPLLKVVVVNQAIVGTSEGFRRMKEIRPDILLFSGEAHEDAPSITENATIVLSQDFKSRGYLIPYIAKQMGAKNLVHISFPRHMAQEDLFLRAKIMEEASKDLELGFFMETALDPTGPQGMEAATDFIKESVPKWLSEYGPDTAFFTTNDALVIPLLEMLKTLGKGYFVEGDIPSTLMGYPEAFQLNFSDIVGQWGRILDRLEEEVAAHGLQGRMGVWVYPLNFSQTTGLVEFGKIMAEGNTDSTDIPTLLKCLGIFSPGAHWNGQFLYSDGKLYENYFVVYQDSYILGKGYIQTTKLIVPPKYLDFAID